MTAKYPSIFDYTNYRLFLRDVYLWRKNQKRGFSYRAFALLAGFASPNFLKLVIDGARGLSEKAAARVVESLNLNETATKYFELLVVLNQAQDDKTRARAPTSLQLLLPYTKKRTLDPGAYHYLSHWLYPVLREMTALPGFRDDPYWIARRLNGKATLQEIARALRFLIEEGYVTRNDQGKLTPAENVILSSDEVRSLAIRNFHRQMLSQAQHMLEILPLHEREFGALTVTLPETSLPALKEKMKAFRQELHQWALNQSEGSLQDVVIQVNLHMYPHTRQAVEDEK